MLSVQPQMSLKRLLSYMEIPSLTLITPCFSFYSSLRSMRQKDDLPCLGLPITRSAGLNFIYTQASIFNQYLDKQTQRKAIFKIFWQVMLQDAWKAQEEKQYVQNDCLSFRKIFQRAQISQNPFCLISKKQIKRNFSWRKSVKYLRLHLLKERLLKLQFLSYVRQQNIMGNNSHHWKTEDSCWKIDQMPKNYEPQRQYQERKALIVVGRMGHGKSSFCKTIVSDSQKHKVKAQNSLKSVTTECTLYESDKFVDIFGQNIYVIDTPGLDSKDASYIIIQEIDNIISQQKLSILGIAYVVDIHQRQKNEKGQNYIFTFFETLRMRFEYKRNISFCVLSKWDKYYDQQQGNNQVFFQMEKEFYKIRFGDTWHRKMFWMSEPTSDVKKFYINVNSPELKPIYQNQMKRLKEFLYLVWNANLTLHYSRFKQDRKTFYNIHLQEMRKEYSSFEYRKQGGDIQLNSTTPPVRYSFFERALQFFGIYKEYKLEQLVNFITKEQINFINESKYKACLQTMIKSNVYITHNRTIFKRANYIEDVKCYNQYGHFIFLHRDNDGNKFAYLEPGSKHKIIFTCKFPTNQCYSQFIRRISKEFFNRNHLK